MGRHSELGRQLTTQHQLQVLTTMIGFDHLKYLVRDRNECSSFININLSGRLSPFYVSCLRVFRLSASTGPRGRCTTWCQCIVSILKQTNKQKNGRLEPMRISGILCPSLFISKLLCSKEILSPVDKRRRNESPTKCSGPGGLPAQDQGNGQV